MQIDVKSYPAMENCFNFSQRKQQIIDICMHYIGTQVILKSVQNSKFIDNTEEYTCTMLTKETDDAAFVYLQFSRIRSEILITIPTCRHEVLNTSFASIYTQLGTSQCFISSLPQQYYVVHVVIMFLYRKKNLSEYIYR